MLGQSYAIWIDRATCPAWHSQRLVLHILPIGIVIHRHVGCGCTRIENGQERGIATASWHISKVKATTGMRGTQGIAATLSSSKVEIHRTFCHNAWTVGC